MAHQDYHPPEPHEMRLPMPYGTNISDIDYFALAAQAALAATKDLAQVDVRSKDSGLVMRSNNVADLAAAKAVLCDRPQIPDAKSIVENIAIALEPDSVSGKRPLIKDIMSTLLGSVRDTAANRYASIKAAPRL